MWPDLNLMAHATEVRRRGCWHGTARKEVEKLVVLQTSGSLKPPRMPYESTTKFAAAGGQPETMIYIRLRLVSPHAFPRAGVLSCFLCVIVVSCSLSLLSSALRGLACEVLDPCLAIIVISRSACSAASEIHSPAVCEFQTCTFYITAPDPPINIV